MGFTLIEMMVALAVFALAAMALIRLEGATIRSTATLDAMSIAQLVARNIAVESLTDATPPPTGETRGIEENGGRSWTWRRDTRAIGDGNAFQIDVRVSDIGGNVLGRLSVIRPPAPPLDPAGQP